MRTTAAPTRAELLRARRLLARVGKGAALLRRKREALVHELFPLARPATEARRAIAQAAGEAYEVELEALALHGEAEVAATGWPTRELTVDVTVQRLWGVTVPRLGTPPAWARGLSARGTAPAATPPTMFEAANRFERLAAELLDAATRELHVRSLGDALARTSRQLHTLEQRVAPALRDRIASVARALDEREREEHTRLRQLRRRRG
ncbi:MAG TPA: V-type ATP synthase subunit D [Kofleriaceae bacterium]|nr:V-type ATP synthase subunit D [Kofleriaceae bacterium]